MSHKLCFLYGTITKNLDLLALNSISNSDAKSSQTESNLRIAPGVGAIKTMSSAYASAPTKYLPIKQPTPQLESRRSKFSI